MPCPLSRIVALTLLLASATIAGAQTFSPPQPEPLPLTCRDQGVVMFSASWCGYCRKARAFFNEHNVEFEEIDYETTPSVAIRTTAKKNGVPYIIVGSEIVNGFNERRLRQLLCLGT